MESAINHELINKLEIAYTINMEKIIPVLSQLMGYRQRLASEIKKYNYSEDHDVFIHLEYINNQIKDILGL